ncbi:MAG TPA: acyl-CoA dehydrogenase family protein, partial [Thermoanaerobaculia bacterium]|nr:acyl-CoA dehydrogenase family protein [Thermoanaerobaculia bacterium]
IEMVNHTRLDCTTGSASGMRAGVAQAIWHAQHRQAFGKTLVDQPLMGNVLADLAIESEAATAAALRVARAYDEAAAGDAGAAAFRRLATAVLKYWVCKRSAPHAAEALECLGGNGYVEDWGLARLYREAPLNSIWEGSGNVQCLDVLRAAARAPEAVQALRAELHLARGADRRYDAFLARLEDDFQGGEPAAEAGARRLVERWALALQAGLLVRHAPPAVADAFCAARLAGEGGAAFGTLPPSADLTTILERAAPTV